LQAKRIERLLLVHGEYEAGRDPAGDERIKQLYDEIEAESRIIAREWEATADLSPLRAEEQVQIPRSVFDLFLNYFQSGSTRDEHLLIASEIESLPHLAAIKLCFDQH
jgi:hypothetical protein